MAVDTRESQVGRDSDNIRRDQELFNRVQFVVRSIENVEGEGKRVYARSSLRSGRLPEYGFLQYVLSVVNPPEREPYFYLHTFKKPTNGRTDEEIFPLIEEELIDLIDAPFTPIRWGRAVFSSDGISEQRAHGTNGSASAFEATAEIISQKPKVSSINS